MWRALGVCGGAGFGFGAGKLGVRWAEVDPQQRYPVGDIGVRAAVQRVCVHERSTEPGVHPQLRDFPRGDGQTGQGLDRFAGAVVLWGMSERQQQSVSEGNVRSRELLVLIGCLGVDPKKPKEVEVGEGADAEEVFRVESELVDVVGHFAAVLAFLGERQLHMGDRIQAAYGGGKAFLEYFAGGNSGSLGLERGYARARAWPRRNEGNAVEVQPGALPLDLKVVIPDVIVHVFDAVQLSLIDLDERVASAEVKLRVYRVDKLNRLPVDLRSGAVPFWNAGIFAEIRNRLDMRGCAQWRRHAKPRAYSALD